MSIQAVESLAQIEIETIVPTAERAKLKAVKFRLVKLHYKNWPKVREYVKEDTGKSYFRVDCRLNGGGHEKSFSTLAEAKAYHDKIKAQRDQHGEASLAAAPVDPRFARWLERAAIEGLDFDQVVELGFIEAKKKKENDGSALMPELCEEWYQAKASNKLKPLREDSLRAARSMANKFAEDFAEVRVAQIDKPFVVDYLNKIEGGNVYRNNIRNYLCNLFNFIIGLNIGITRNPAEKKSSRNPNGIEIDARKHGEAPEYYSVENARTIMRVASQHPEHTARFALGLFAGIRPKETSRLQWYNEKDGWGVNLDAGWIMMPGKITKTKEPRQFGLRGMFESVKVAIPENLLAWLKAFKKDGKPLIVKKGFKQAFAAVNTALNGDAINDGMRHTYATFAYQLHHSFNELEHVMGNSKDVIKKFYKGTINNEIVSEFWAITPETIKA